MASLRRPMELACEILAIVGLGTLLVLATLTMLDGVLRFAISRPIDLVREVSDLVAAVAVSCCLPMSLLRRSNITLRMFHRLSSRGAAHAVDAASDLLVLVVVAASGREFFRFAEKTALAGDVTWLMNIPKAPFWFVVSGIFVLATLVQGTLLVETASGRRPSGTLEETT